MSQEIEIEFKNLLTEAEFNLLLTVLPFPTKATQQTNYYFETNHMDLKRLRSALRIRKANNTYRLTLKEPHDIGLLETHDELTEEEAFQWIKGAPTQTTHVFKQLQLKHIHLNELKYFGKLTTHRRTYKTDAGVLIVLDDSAYNGYVDYELEVEAPAEYIGLNVFDSILNDYQIIKKPTPNKIERFFSTL